MLDVRLPNLPLHTLLTSVRTSSTGKSPCSFVVRGLGDEDDNESDDEGRYDGRHVSREENRRPSRERSQDRSRDRSCEAKRERPRHHQRRSRSRSEEKYDYRCDNSRPGASNLQALPRRRDEEHLRNDHDRKSTSRASGSYSAGSSSREFTVEQHWQAAASTLPGAGQADKFLRLLGAKKMKSNDSGSDGITGSGKEERHVENVDARHIKEDAAVTARHLEQGYNDAGMRRGGRGGLGHR